MAPKREMKFNEDTQLKIKEILKESIVNSDLSQELEQLLRLQNIIKSDTTRVMLKSSRPFINTFRYYLSSFLPNDIKTSKIYRNNIIVSDFDLINNTPADVTIMLKFQINTGRLCTVDNLIDLKKNRHALANFITRTLWMTIGHFQLYEDEVIDISPEDMRIAAMKQFIEIGRKRQAKETCHCQDVEPTRTRNKVDCNENEDIEALCNIGLHLV